MRTYPSTFVTTLTAWCNNPPPGVKILEFEVTEEKVRIRFTSPEAFALAVEFFKEWPFVGLVQDGTFQTNQQNLVLFSVSLAGNMVYRNNVHVRVLPVEFLLADAEDFEAFHMVLQGCTADLSTALEFPAASKVTHI